MALQCYNDVMRIPFLIIRSNRRTAALEFTEEGFLRVRAPLWLTDRQAEELVQKNELWIKVHQSAAVERCRRLQAFSAEDIEKLKRRAREILPERVKYYSHLMQLTPTAVKITAAKKRFGSCSGKNSLCFSCFLVLYPPAAVDYVVVHELAHIRYHNHSSAFHALVKQYLPDAEQRRKLLKQPFPDKVQNG